MPDMSSLLAHLKGQPSLFDSEITLLQTETVYEDTEKTPHICFSAIRGHTDAKRALRLAAIMC